MNRVPPGPKDWLLGFGNVNRLRKDPLRFLLDMGRTCGDISRIRVPLPPFYIYLVNNPDLIRDVLITKAKSFRKIAKATLVLKRIAGDGLLISEGELWLRQRRLVQPAFHASRMSRYAEVVVARTRRMLHGWQPGALLNMPEEMRQLTLAIIAKALFDVELTPSPLPLSPSEGERGGRAAQLSPSEGERGDQTDSLYSPIALSPSQGERGKGEGVGRAAQLSEVSRILTETTFREVVSLFTLPDWLPLPSKRRKRWALQTLDQLIGDIIRGRRASGEDKGDLLSMLLLAVDEEGDRRGMTDQQARDEATSLFLAGHDTAAAALTWVWYAIARHPEVEARLCREVESVLGERPASIEDLPRLQYTGMVVKESLRLYPPIWDLTTRETVSNVELGAYDIPKGSWIALAPYVTQRDPRFFPNPDQFDPERFAAGRAEQIPPYAYFPFGAGPHVCIGNTFAMMEMTLVVATILQQFRVALGPGQGEVVPEPDIMIRPKGGLRMSVSKRATLAMVGTD
jgi:cytochrome P450